MTSILCLFIIDRDPSLTGAPRTVLNLLTELRRKGIKPILVTQRESVLTDRLVERDIDVEILSLPSILNIFDEGVFQYSWAKKLRSIKAVAEYNGRIADLARSYNVDGIWARQIKGVLLSGFASRWMRLPLIWDIGVEKKSTGLVYLLHWVGLLLASKIVTQARIQSRTIFGEYREQLFESKFESINPGIDDSRRRSIERAASESSETDIVRIITVGSIHPRKNQKMLLQLLPDVISSFKNISVQIVGPFRDIEYTNELRKLVDKNGLGGHVEFTGWREDVPELLGRSDIFVLSSHAEGVPQVIREAMYARLPIVATAVGGVPEAVRHGETGFLVSDGNQEQMEEYLITLLAEPEMRRKMGDEAFHHAQSQFTKENWISTYVELLRSME